MIANLTGVNFRFGISLQLITATGLVIPAHDLVWTDVDQMDRR
jgi:hypothetical protein